MEQTTLRTDIAAALQQLGIESENAAASSGSEWFGMTGALREVHSPADGALIASVHMADEAAYETILTRAQEAFPVWRSTPAPVRGEVVRQIGVKLRHYKEALGQLVTYEMGKVLSEGLGEVQEMIDICDFAVGQSRQLYGLTMHSERPSHRMYEQYHPLGPIGIISAFNFPVAVWSWNAMLAAVCGDVCIWKPSEKTPLTAIACQRIVAQVLQENDLPEGIFNLIVGDATIGKKMAEDRRLPLVSATGSTRMGQSVGQAVGARLGRSLLELGGNNAIIITPHADLELAIRATAFGAVGTCGQRCTTTRRLIVHEYVYEEVKNRLLRVYEQLRIGDPLKGDTLVGPLIDRQAVETMQRALEQVKAEGGNVLVGGEPLQGSGYESGTYVRPALVEAENHYATVQEETFAPILYLIRYEGEIEKAIALQNDVRQGLSSALFSLNIHETEAFLSHAGSDCGIANINIGTSGAEIGGAFGGEKETGGGRESGSDAWKAYMRRQTNTINYGRQLPLAQGVSFDI
ncbi:aldehyde dehydrogenase (NAD+) [Catalinimonas alkaloidigena]|uniref:aldehyde dehydrogenase (NAD(+)) n=1 Tax=Catalinimonas alkaloidigena TaxID=1075417 RepID=A0A1G9DSC6_9BACT|nr:aldehyde dehydrogenase family protein [Catalinimonas alkaloidigena]SDK66730.1 aldehyde dehydrogenase (NAD+) [Catalinimonas alkaloidigena]